MAAGSGRYRATLVGTAKRDRQKINRQQRLQELARDARRKRSKRLAMQFGIGIPVAVVAVIVLVLLTRNGNDNTSASPTTTEAAPTTTGAPAPCPAADGSSPKTTTFAGPQQMCIDPAKTYSAEVVTNLGAYTIALDTQTAPNTVNNFVVLARYHFFDGISCHRIIPGFMAQCGDPTGTGNGGPGYEFADELPTGENPYAKGTVAMANSGPNTNGSQFFTVTGDASSLPPNYSVFGHVTSGLDDTLPALDAAGNPDPSANGVPPKSPVTITSVTITEA
jgi:cyclophilin family peptidyl-prolyl cis-trans isomerase